MWPRNVLFTKNQQMFYKLYLSYIFITIVEQLKLNLVTFKKVETLFIVILSGCLFNINKNINYKSLTLNSFTA